MCISFLGYALGTGKVVKKVKEHYIQQIIELLQQCNDIELLDLILKLLQKSGQDLIGT